MSGSIGASSWRRSRASRSMTASCAKAPGTPSATWPSWATACTSCWPGTMRRGGTGGRPSWRACSAWRTCSRRRARTSSACPGGRSRCSMWRRPSRSSRASRSSSTRASPRARATRATPSRRSPSRCADRPPARGRRVPLARGLGPTARPGEPLPGADDAVVDGVWDAIARDHPRSEDLLDLCRTETTAIEGFVRQRGIITLPEDPLRIAWTPLFLRPYGGAFLSPPGPLDQGQLSEFWVTPPDPEWPAERLESYLREENDRMLRILCIHEAIPGHYLQLAASNRSSSLARSVFQSGTFAEGWAVYVTQVMMDEGYGADDPALLFCHWKYYLRAIVNTLLDIGVHVEGMGEDEAMRLMIGGAFQEEQEARAKYLRARLSSTQLSTYYVGSLEMWDLETAARRRAAVAAGGGGGAGPQARP